MFLRCRAFSSDPCRKKSKSSAKKRWGSSEQLLFSVTPFNLCYDTSFLTFLDSTSASKMNRYGENGRLVDIFALVEWWLVEMHSFILVTHYSEKPHLFKLSSRNFHSTRSYDFCMSNFREQSTMFVLRGDYR